MKVQNLQIGDWVISKDLKTPIRVTSIMCHYGTTIAFFHNASEFMVRESQIEPIPLTPEILEKNFGKPSRFGPLDRVCWGCIERLVGVRLFELDTCFWVEIDTQQTGQKNESDNCHIKKYIRYVHGLQHALKLCGIEKEITL